MALDKRNPFSSFRSREKEVEIDDEEVQVKAKPRTRRPTPPAPKPELTQRANTPSGLPPASSPTRTSARPVKTSAPAPTPKAEAQPKRRGRKEGLTVNSSASSAPSGYSSLYGLPSLSNYTSTSNAPAQKNKIIPALRAAGQRKLDKGEARSLDQGTALEIVGKIVGKNVTINDIEKEKANTQALFASTTELVTLYELAMRMVESHQFYTRAV